MDYKGSSDASIEQSRWLIQRLLSLFSSMAAAGTNEKAAEFRNKLAGVTKTIINPLPGESGDIAARKCLALCQDFFQLSNSYRVNNEGTYEELIDLLRDALRSLAGEASLEGMMVTSTARFREMVEIQDVCQLKKRLAEEVHAIEQSVRQQQANRDRTIHRLTERTQSLEQRLQRTRERLTVTLAESSMDPLTRVANRRYFDVQLASWMAPQAKEHPFVLAMFDIDDFKKVNDAYGHQVGDRVLRSIARTLRQVTRDEDVLARYGGEEFVLLLRNFSADKAIHRCNEILRSVAAQTFDWEDSACRLRLHTTISCGITEYARGDSVYALLHRADTALYTAKKLGKNRTEIQRKRTSTNSDGPYQHV